VSIDDNEELITVKSGSKYYPPISVPTGIFSDSFDGENAPHRGRWIPFLTYTKDVYPLYYPFPWYCYVNGRLNIGIKGGDGPGHLSTLNLMTRAEFKTPFTVSFDLQIQPDPGQYDETFHFYITTPDPHDGYVLDSNEHLVSHLYGGFVCLLLASIGDHPAANAYNWVLDFDGYTASPDNAWQFSHDYNVLMEFTNDEYGSMNLEITITDKTGPPFVVWNTIISDIPHARNGFWRCIFSAQTYDSLDYYSYYTVKDFKIIREPSNKPKSIITIMPYQGTEYIWDFEEGSVPTDLDYNEGEGYLEIIEDAAFENTYGAHINVDPGVGVNGYVSMYSVIDFTKPCRVFDFEFYIQFNTIDEGAEFQILTLYGLRFYFGIYQESSGYWSIQDDLGSHTTTFAPVIGDFYKVNVKLDLVRRTQKITTARIGPFNPVTIYNTPPVEKWGGYFTHVSIGVNGSTSEKEVDIYLDYISITDTEQIIEAIEDTIDVEVTERKDSYPSANVTLRNTNLQYNYLLVTQEIEIRSGNEAIMWLLFRGNIDLPVLAYPPTTTHISAKGFGKRLDHRETDENSWIAQDPYDIIQDLIFGFYPDIFTTDHVISPGTSQSLDSDDQPVSSPLRTLCEVQGNILYVDWNWDVHYLDPADDITDSNLIINLIDDIIGISRRSIDEIINNITVKGTGFTGTASDPTSINTYWRRDKTFTDESLTSQASVDDKADELLNQYTDSIIEIPVSLNEWFILTLNDRVYIDCEKVNTDENVIIDSITYSISPEGRSTTVNGVYKGVTMADILVDLSRRIG
jgi:hypothetical protein